MEEPSADQKEELEESPKPLAQKKTEWYKSVMNIYVLIKFEYDYKT